MQIYSLSYFKEISSVLEKHYFNKYNISLNDVSNITIIQSDIIIIFEPFKIDSRYSSLSPIWKRYLTIHSPETKLIVMGFCNFQSRNYIDLLNLPKDFNAYVENSLDRKSVV